MASTPEATKSQAESREGFRHGTPRPAATVAWEAPDAYVLGSGVTRAERIKPYERSRSDPVYRPLRVFTRDPATSVLAGAIAVINLPYELLLPGPEGALFKVVGTADNPRGGLLDLNEPNLLLSSGVATHHVDSQFRQQLV